MSIRFVHPSMLAVAAGVMMAPVVLHLLSRWRYRSVAWGAMMFLSETAVPRRQSGRLRQWVLLSLRMLILGLLGLALARPVFGGDRSSGEPQASTAVIIFDRSASMAIDENGRSRLALARDAAQQIVQGMVDRHVHDQVALLTLGDPSPAAAVVPTADLHEIQHELADLTTTTGVADIAQALLQAQGILEKAPIGPRAIFLISDRQALNWQNVEAKFLNNWHRSTPVVWIPIGSDGSSNVALQKLEISNPPAIAEIPIDAVVRLHNFGPTARNGVQVFFALIDERGTRRQLGSATARLPADGDAELHFSFTSNEPGCRLLSADVRSAGMTIDKHLDYAFDVLDPLRVLIVRDEPPPRPDVIRLALSPFPSSRPGGAHNPATVQTVLSQDCQAATLVDQDVVILAGVQQLSAAQATALEKFAFDGGGLLIAPDESVHLQDDNSLLYRDGQGILPAPWAIGETAPRSEETVTWFDPSNAIFNFLSSRGATLSGISIRKFVPVNVPEKDSTIVLARFGSGAPFLLQRAAGYGHVTQCSTTLNADWNDLPLTGLYLPLLQSITRDLARGRAIRRNLRLGQPISETFDRPIDPRTLKMQLPNNEPFDPAALEWSMSNGRGILRYLQTEQAGTYRLRYATATTRPLQELRSYFVIRGIQTESDITPVTSPRHQKLWDSVGLKIVGSVSVARRSAVTSQPQDRELWMGLLMAVLWLVGVELLVARLLSHGGRKSA